MRKLSFPPYLLILFVFLLSCRSGQPEVIEHTPTPTAAEIVQTPALAPITTEEYRETEEPAGYPLPAAQPSPYPEPETSPDPYPIATPFVEPPYPGPAVPPTQLPGEGAYPYPVESEGRTPAPAIVTPGMSPSPQLESTSEPIERPPASPMPPPSGEAVTISIWHSWSSLEVQVLNSILRSFQSAYPDVYFDVMYLPRENLQRRYETAVYLGGGPSLLFGPADWGPTLYEQDLVVNIADLAPEDFLARINPAAVEQGRLGDALISLPYSIRQGVVLYRNKQIIETAPATFDKLVQAARSATAGGVVGAYLERSYFYSAAHLFGLGGSLMDENGNPTFNTTEGVQWLRLLNSFAQAGPHEFNGNRDRDAFKTGNVGIIIDGSWIRATLADAIGENNLAVDPWPIHDSGHLSGFIRTDNVYLNANLSEPERYQPLLFMAFMLTPEVQALMSQVGSIPVVNDAPLDDPIMQQMVIAFQRATSFPTIRQAGAYWDPLEAAMLNVFNNRASPLQALNTAEAEVKEALQNLPP
jgi:arabinogalactan oligomer / maltooligosaccharide transport system substrate-binding protein